LEKFHPDFDPILAGILRRDESAAIVVLADESGLAPRALRRRFAASIPDVAERIVFLPRQPFPDYLSLVAASDALLDTLYYTGGTTTLHGLCLGKPIVTQPSRFLAGRATFAYCQQIGVTDCIASSSDQYVDIAVRLGMDADYRADVSERIAARSGVMYECFDAVRELEGLFQQLINDARAQ
jgi:predicted O-linked N-acetylglucosamine transferase (SPINDLY family)